jgi:hypothetical protein
MLRLLWVCWVVRALSAWSPVPGCRWPGSAPRGCRRLGPEVAASSDGGGGLDAFGGVHILERRGGTWKVVGMEQAWIA